MNPKDSYGRTPLMIACMTGNEDALRSLINQAEKDLYCEDDLGKLLIINQFINQSSRSRSGVLLQRKQENQKIG